MFHVDADIEGLGHLVVIYKAMYIEIKVMNCVV